MRWERDGSDRNAKGAGLMADAEGAHLLLQNLLSSTFDPESEEYRELNTKVVEAVKKAGEGAWQAKRIIRHETASRV